MQPSLLLLLRGTYLHADTQAIPRRELNDSEKRINLVLHSHKEFVNRTLKLLCLCYNSQEPADSPSSTMAKHASNTIILGVHGNYFVISSHRITTTVDKWMICNRPSQPMPMNQWNPFVHIDKRKNLN